MNRIATIPAPAMDRANDIAAMFIAEVDVASFIILRDALARNIAATSAADSYQPVDLDSWLSGM